MHPKHVLNKFIFSSEFAISIVIVIFIALSSFSALKESMTYDELFNISDGRNSLITKQYTDEPYNPPLPRMLYAIPTFIFAPNENLPTNYTYFVSRFINIFCCAAFLLYLFIQLRTLMHPVVGVWASIFTAFDPSFLSHSHYVTPDTMFTIFTTIALFELFKLYIRKSKISSKWVIRIAFISGCALSSKVPALLILGISFVLMICMHKLNPIKLITNTKFWLGAMTMFVTIWSVYFFQPSVILAKREDSQRVSAQLKEYFVSHNITIGTQTLSFLENQPVPLGQYIALIKNTALRGRGSQNVYVLSNHFDKTPWYALSLMWFIKTPISILLLLLFGIYILYTRSVTAVVKKYIRFMTIPIVITFILFSVSGGNPMVRYLLPTVPLVASIAAIALKYVSLNHKIAYIIPIWYVVSVLWYMPHPITYANELAGARKYQYQFILDSNSDWGGGLPTLQEYIKKNNLKNFDFSYFGTDNPARYGFIGYEYNKNFYDRCLLQQMGESATSRHDPKIMSISNWYYCKFYEQDVFKKDKIKYVISDQFLRF